MEQGPFIVQPEPLDLLRLQHAVWSEEHGAVGHFVGIVRRHNVGRTVTGITYEAHVKLCQKSFANIATSFSHEDPARHVRIAIAHRIGHLAVGEASVVVTASSKHRKACLDAVHQSIDRLKHESPIWKLEHYSDGNSGWVQGHSLCQGGTDHA